MKNWFKSLNFNEIFPAVFVGWLFLLNVLPIIAPVLDHFGEKNFSGFIYTLYSFLCHQKASRSFFICDGQCGWCARCTFIWFATFVTAGYVFYAPQKTEETRIKPISWQVGLLLVLPMALDGTIQLIATVYSFYTGATPFYESTNTLRAITGALFGLGIGLFMFPRLKEELKV